ncbi:MAG TPA: GNAT family N-acetyltransferase [Ktedonobacterales bacterium]|nr:GNAT family N-acetyltransferase [Ktedonobacterales bacterium]
MTSTAPRGYFIRACSPGDLDAIEALIATCETEEMGSPDPAMIEGFTTTWQRSDFDCAHNAWLALDAGSQQVLGYAHLQPVARTDLQAFASVHPHARGRGIGAALLARIEQRATDQLAHFAPDDRIVIQQWITAANKPAHRLLEQSGYQVVRHIWGMMTTLAAEPAAVIWPANITVRTPVTDADLRAAHTAYREAFQDHWGYAEQSYENFSREMIEIDTFDPSLWFLAMDGDEVAGVVMGETLIDRGWVNELAVRRGWRGRGLGTALLRHMFGEFYRRGLHTVALGVDSQNLTGATRIYERAGMRVERQYDICEKTLQPGTECVQETRKS